jgi:hypothetical protein
MGRAAEYRSISRAAHGKHLPFGPKEEPDGYVAPVDMWRSAPEMAVQAGGGF